MKRLIYLLAMLFAASAQAQEIKGISIGMTKEQMLALYPDGTKNLTVGGISSDDGMDPVQYTNDRVTGFAFRFSGDHFEEMKGVVKAE